MELLGHTRAPRQEDPRQNAEGAHVLPSQGHREFSYSVGDVVLNVARALGPARVPGEPDEDADDGSNSAQGSPPRLMQVTLNGGGMVITAHNLGGMARRAAPPAQPPLEAVVGEVLRCCEGRVWVHWVDGSESALLPDQIGLLRHSVMSSQRVHALSALPLAVDIIMQAPLR